MPRLPKSTVATATTSLKVLLAKLKSHQASFNIICQFKDDYPEDATANQINVRLERLDELWELMSEVTSDIMAHDDFEGTTATFDKERSSWENLYYEVKSFLLDKLKDFTQPNLNQSTLPADQSTSSGSMDHVRLPPITLQKFDGNIDEWLSFRDLYTSLIHWKTDLPDVEKFHYLRSSLIGEALSHIANIKISKANYALAWETLTKEYNNHKLLKKKQAQSFFELPVLVKESAKDLHKLVESFNMIVQSLDQVVQPNDYKDLLLVELLSSRLDPATRRGWEEFTSTKETDSLKNLTDFLTRRVRILEALPVKTSEYKQDSNAAAKKKPFQVRVSHNAVQKPISKCPACPESHGLYICPTFQKMSVASRESFIRNNNLCRNCLRSGHQAKKCTSRFSCRNCKARHHTMVCFQPEGGGNARSNPTEMVPTTSNNNQRQSTPGETASTAAGEQVSSHVANRRTSKILLATAVVLIENEHGLRVPARALLDSGSECNFISEKLCQQLRIQREKVDVSITGIGNATTKAKHRVQATIKSRFSIFSRDLHFIVLPKVTVDLPMTQVDITEWEIPDGIDLADPSFFKPGSVDLVIGIQAFFSFFKTGKELSLGNGLPTLTESVFGWIISGEVVETSQPTTITCNMALTDRLDELLERFWACEEVGDSNNYSVDETRCEEQYQRTVKRAPDGRYTVTLPKHEGGLEQLGDSEEIATKRLYGLERRLERDLELRKQYNDFMTEYITLGHMEKVDDDSRANVKRCFLPHHPVLRESSTTTKCRVVFDASCKTSTGVSLNDTLLVGPIVQQDLRTIMLRARVRQVMLVADVEKMFRQIDMDPEDRPLQSIKWRFGPNEEVASYELSTVTYGTKPAPFLATRTLKQLATDERERFPLAAESVDDDIYMDDVICGAADLDTAINLRQQYDGMMASGGLRLRKWASNWEDALKGVPNENLAFADEVSWDQDASVKTLGLTWLPRTDQFRFNFQIPEIKSNQPLTKRIVTSIVARLFDPLGLIGACVVGAKIYLQELWDLIDKETGKPIDWDTELPATVGEKIRRFLLKIPHLNELRIPRCVLARGATKFELHCFTDASEKAYGACVYLRSMDAEGNISVHLLTSKSKVAPRKLQTLPRLELCGAYLGALLVEKVLQALKVSVNVYYWTDSTCVLMWLRAVPSTWVTYVANRVAKIQALTAGHTWHHVPGTINPADLISRGIPPDMIGSNVIWWEGPIFLKLEKDQWPSQPTVSPDEAPERRKTACTATQEQTPFSVDFVSRYSSYMKLVRSTAYWLRLKAMLRHQTSPKQHKFLSATEFKRAELAIVGMVQREVFADELKALSEGKSVARSSPLRWFTPAVDENGILRVGGRLSHSQETHDTKHPMVLPAKHPLTQLIFEDYHEQLLHAGPQQLLAAVRQRFWPLGGRNTARSVYHRCQRCFRAKPIVLQQQMGQLPSARVTACKPFLKVGLDFFGPVFTKAGRGRTAIKSYVAVFVCMCTKAVHMEHVSDLSTERFLQALRRFIARRGRPSDIYSDNGTNFVGARNQLLELFNILESDREVICREATKEGINWHFNPPSAPHFGGLWEAAVRSAKYHLLRVLGNSTVSAEDFNTLLVQVEGVLNSRPLTPLSDDPTDLEPLTPAHFLTGGPIHALPEPDYSNEKLNRLSRWQLVQRQLQDFWTRWRKEYLTQLQAKPKNWKSPVKVDVGMLVIIVDENQPPMRWKLGRIEELHPGDDGVVRVVTVRTATRSYKRPVVKLCILPTPDSESS